MNNRDSSLWIIMLRCLGLRTSPAVPKMCLTATQLEETMLYLKNSEYHFSLYSLGNCQHSPFLTPQFTSATLLLFQVSPNLCAPQRWTILLHASGTCKEDRQLLHYLKFSLKLCYLNYAVQFVNSTSDWIIYYFMDQYYFMCNFLLCSYTCLTRRRFSLIFWGGIGNLGRFFI